ncbi:MAG TPA: TIGR01244 family sulfur transferase [Burkholderiaceae bacterium]|nr:TIGR01244 family sulfur transferase [Burkholderiaceae bacterium]
MSISLRPIAPDVFVAPQLTPEAIPEVAAAGFKSVINNRPDFEHGPDQPTSAAIEAAAKAAGLQYLFLPVASGHQSPEEIERFAEALNTMPRPLVAFCRSGARSTRLFMAASAL